MNDRTVPAPARAACRMLAALAVMASFAVASTTLLAQQAPPQRAKPAPKPAPKPQAQPQQPPQQQQAAPPPAPAEQQQPGRRRSRN